MKVFLSSIENTTRVDGKFLAEYIVENIGGLNYSLMSYYYIKNNVKHAEYIRDNSKEVLIDSGAHSFQFGKKVNFEEYTKQYAEFIKKFDTSNVVGYFEMDVDNIIGYDKVLELRKILESVSSKIIPVWHKNRGIEEYKKMCKDYAGKIIAITGFLNTDIRDDDYLMFLKEAKKYNCKVHCLGMTRRKVLDKCPFDYVDSSTWVQQSIFGNIQNQGKVTKEFSKTSRHKIYLENYKEFTKLQKYYYQKWKKECKD